MRRKITGKKKVGAAKTGAVKSRRRRRVGATGKIEPILMNGLGVGAGVIAAREGSILLGSFIPSLMASPMITGAVETAAGLATAIMSKNGFLMYMGLGIMGNGIMTMVQGTGVISGPPALESYAYNRRQMGDSRLQFVAGPMTRIGSPPSPIAVVAGAGIGAGRKKRCYVS